MTAPPGHKPRSDTITADVSRCSWGYKAPEQAHCTVPLPNSLKVGVKSSKQCILVHQSTKWLDRKPSWPYPNDAYVSRSGRPAPRINSPIKTRFRWLLMD